MSWLEFEKKCVYYLNNRFGNNNISFKNIGVHNSNMPDIVVLNNLNIEFCMEAKMPNAQSGQFVLLDDNTKFVYSEKNKSEINKFSEIIINYINDNYENYKNVTTKSIEIDLDSNIFNDWIINHYAKKNVKFIISIKPNGEYIIFPLIKFFKYFKIKSNFRIKTSGSRNISRAKINEFKTIFHENYGKSIIKEISNKFLLKTNQPIPDKTKISDGLNRYQLNKIDYGYYEIRQLSNTNNPNVIFSIELIDLDNSDDFAYFTNTIEKLK